MNAVAAVDCGATSVRVCRIDLDAVQPSLEVVHRVSHHPSHDAVGHLRWDWDTIVTSVVDGLEKCLERGELASIGVDTWAVDYGLLDDNGALVGAPYSYRDQRTDGYREIVDAFGARAMYAINGLQLQPFNTVFQLAYHDRAELERASRLLWLPELIVHHLTGASVAERTSAGSSGLVDVATGAWSTEMLNVAGVERGLLGEIHIGGKQVGDWRGIPVSLVGGHDTASAVVGMGLPSPGGSAFVSTGTWMLVGVERESADTSAWAADRNFTNEAGVIDGVRFLRNVTGFWILEQCRTQWTDLSISDLVSAAEDCGSAPVVDIDHPDLQTPGNMLSTYTEMAGLGIDADPGLVTRSIIESIAVKTTEVVSQLAEVSTFEDLVLFGGAARMELLVRRIEELSGRRVRLGSAEAAALGNAIVQGIAIGLFSNIEEGRERIGSSDSFTVEREYG